MVLAHLSFLVEARHYLAEIDTFLPDLDLILVCLAHVLIVFVVSYLESVTGLVFPQ